ncbi:MAG: hypothetical protein HY547_00305 [Elusimicrobia bacterium]|nr:hypothetical protein [Elusimicrobiota bacterium]
MKHLLTAALVNMTAVNMPLYADHGQGAPDAPADFAYEDLRCRWEGGAGSRVVCEDQDGGGISASCDDLKKICEAGLTQTKMGIPAIESQQEQNHEPLTNAQGEPCQTLQTGTVACTKKDGSIYASRLGAQSAASILFDGNADVSIFNSADGYTCEVTAGRYSVCEKHDETGRLAHSFGATCDMRPDLCGPASDSTTSPSTQKQAEQIAVFPQGNDGLPELDLGLGSSGNSTTTPAAGSPAHDNGLLMTEGAPSVYDPLMEQSESALRQTDAAIKKVWREVKKGAQSITNAAAAQLNHLSLRLWHAISHQVTRTQVMRRLPAKYFASNGIFEKPDKVLLELNLIAEPGLPAMLRDVSVTEECLGAVPGQASVQHVDMLAQCGRVAFGESRRFKI